MKQCEYSIWAMVMVLLAGCQPQQLPDSAVATSAGVLPIATGAYVEQDEECGNPGALFRYDGRSMGWTRGAERPMYPIRRVREEHGLWVATIVAPGPGAAPVPRELDVFIVPRDGGRITVTAMERTDMKLCPPGELPAGQS